MNTRDPFSLSAEISVLGAMVQFPEAIPEAAGVLKYHMFSRDAHRRLFRAMICLSERGDAVDVITLGEELKKTGELEAAGGFPYLAELLDAVPTAANVEYHAQIVREKAQIRALRDACARAISELDDPGTDPAGVIDSVEAIIMEATAGFSSTTAMEAPALFDDALAQISEIRRNGGSHLGVRTGFPDLDRLLCRLEPGDLIILAARPSMGKTALATSISLNVAQAGEVVAVLSLEQSCRELSNRMIAHEAGVNLKKLRGGDLSDADMAAIRWVVHRLKGIPLILDDGLDGSLLGIRAAARRLASRHELGLVVVDYLGLMTGHRNLENRTQEVGEVTRGLKRLAREIECPVLALSQLNRGVEHRRDRRPQLADLRESGDIEQDADVVLFVHRPEMYCEADVAAQEGLVGKAEIIVGKQRNGPTGSVSLHFDKETTRFYSVERALKPPQDTAGRPG